MNVRIESRSLRFRISEEELKDILEGKGLREEITLAGKLLSVVIAPHRDEQATQVKLDQDRDSACITLHLPAASAQSLSQMGRNRNGLKQVIDGLEIMLQVDLRSETRKAAAR